MLFFDASAVVSAYARQANSARVRALLKRDDVAVSRLTEVETVSGIARLAREDAITRERREDILAAFLTDFGAWFVVDVTPDVTARARVLLLNHALRTGDAIQLASALLLQSELAGQLEGFVTFDRRLLDAARAERLNVSI